MRFVCSISNGNDNDNGSNNDYDYDNDNDKNNDNDNDTNNDNDNDSTVVVSAGQLVGGLASGTSRQRCPTLTTLVRPPWQWPLPLGLPCPP